MEKSEKLQGLKFDGYKGSWHEIEKTEIMNQKIVLLESENYGNDVCYMIAEIDKNGNLKLVIDEADSISDYSDYIWDNNLSEFNDIL